MKSRKSALVGLALFAAVAATATSTQAFAADVAAPAPSVSAVANATQVPGSWSQIANLTKPKVDTNSATALLSDGNYIFATMSNPASKTGSVVLLNAETHAQVGSIAVGWQPHAIVKVNNQYWVANNDGTVTVLQLNGTTLTKVSTINVSSRFLVSMTVGPNGNVFAVSSDSAGLNLTEVNSSTQKVVNTVTNFAPKTDIGGPIAQTDGALFIPVQTGGDAQGAVLKVNPETGAIENTIDVGAPSKGLPTDVAVDASGNVWIANYEGNQVLEVSAQTGSITKTIPVNSAREIAFDGNSNVFVTQSQDNTVSVINAQSGTVTQQGIKVGAYPTAIVVDSTGHPWTGNLMNAPTDPPGGSISVIGNGSE